MPLMLPLPEAQTISKCIHLRNLAASRTNVIYQVLIWQDQEFANARSHP